MLPSGCALFRDSTLCRTRELLRLGRAIPVAQPARKLPPSTTPRSTMPYNVQSELCAAVASHCVSVRTHLVQAKYQEKTVTDLNPQAKQMADESMVRGLD